MIGREREPPYERPPLSKRYLLGVLEPAELRLPPVRAHLELGREVVAIEAGRHAVRLRDGASIPYDRLLLATGAGPLRLPGYEAAHYLRELRHADALRAQLRSGTRLDVIGAGFIGCEVAAVARQLGLSVAVHEALAQPLLRVLSPELGAWLADVHRARGVDLRTGVSELPAPGPATLVAIGSEPDVELAEAAGIRCDRGVLVDELGRTSAEDIYAAGDCARFWSPLFNALVRVEHFQTAVRQGIAVGRAMAGDEQPFAEAPWFWSDQYELNLQYVGGGLPWDETIVRGKLGEPPFTVFFRADGRLRAALGVDDGRTVSRARHLLELGLHPAAAELADPSVDLKRLAARR